MGAKTISMVCFDLIEFNFGVWFIQFKMKMYIFQFHVNRGESGEGGVVTGEVNKE